MRLKDLAGSRDRVDKNYNVMGVIVFHGRDQAYAVKGAKGKLTVTSKQKWAVTVPNCMLKGLWGEEGSGGIRKKLKSRSTAYL